MQASKKQEKPIVVVSVPPQAGLMKILVQDRAQVMTLVTPGQSPATYEPTPRQMSGLAKAWLYVRVGAPFERGFADKLAEQHPDLKVLDARDVVELRTKTGEVLAAGADKDQADHHIWLDPLGLKSQVRAIAAALAEKDPAGKEIYELQRNDLIKTLDLVDQGIARRLKPFAGRSFMVHHPAYTYFAQRYGLKQVAVEHGGKHPHAKDMAALIEHARKSKVKVIFVQPQFSDASAKLVAEAIGGQVVALAPLAENPIENLKRMAEMIASAMSKTGE